MFPLATSNDYERQKINCSVEDTSQGNVLQQDARDGDNKLKVHSYIITSGSSYKKAYLRNATAFGCKEQDTVHLCLRKYSSTSKGSNIYEARILP